MSFKVVFLGFDELFFGAATNFFRFWLAAMSCSSSSSSKTMLKKVLAFIDRVFLYFFKYLGS
jgi:hypothetical protein